MRMIAFIILLMLVPAVSAGEWRGEGTPLYIIADGKIHGGVVVKGGHGYTMENPYEEYFDLPEGIEYARLYVPMWNYNEDDWLEVKINEENLGRRSVPDYVAAWGIANYAYTVTDKVSPGKNRVSVNYHNTNGGPYSIVLIAVYKDPTLPQSRFWISEGNNALSYVTKKDSAELVFSGEIPIDIKKATLTTMMIAGTEGEIDYLYFNSNLLGKDVGRGKSGAYFDLDRWDVKEFLDTANNTVKFEKGDEIYIHPFNAVLAVEYQQEQGEDYLEIKDQFASKGRSIPFAVIAVLVGSVIFFVYRSRRKK
jgi:hypothetical protein